MDAEISNFSENYYELSSNGICPQYCAHCKLNFCLKCGNEFGILELNENSINKRICIKLDELKKGYYKNNKEQIFYKCLNNCEICENADECIQCKSGYNLLKNKNICEEESKNKSLIFIVVLVLVIVLLIILFFIIKAYRKRTARILEFNNKSYINEKLF